jgi:glutamate racemase
MAAIEKVDFRRRVEIVAAMLRGHLAALEVEEDDEKVCMKMNPCGSGQRLLEAGAYDQPRNLAMLEKPHLMTWGLTHFPVYCTHAPVMEVLMIEKLGWPVFVIQPGAEVARQSCAYCLYKNPEDIPDKVFARVGKRKPGGAHPGK